jgi:hypothetical protein
MEKFPQELVFGLIFGAVLLVQFVLKRLRGRTPPTDAEPDTELGLDAEAQADAQRDSVARRPAAATAPQPAQTLNARPLPAPPRKALAPARHDARRFSLRSLLGNRRAVQEAIVIAAIVGPCRAHTGPTTWVEPDGRSLRASSHSVSGSVRQV